MTQDEIPDLEVDEPHGARIWNYLLGGKDNYPMDRQVGDVLIRTVRFLAGEAGAEAQADLGSPYYQRTVEEIERWFDGLEIVEPGVVSVTQWRPVDAEIGQIEAIDGYGAVARKP